MSEIDDYRDPSINPANLDYELETQAAKYLHVAEMYACAEGDYESFKSQISQLSAKLDEQIRKEAAAATPPKKPTEAAITKEIERNVDYVTFRQHLIKLRRQREVLRALKDAWLMRKDLLIQRCIKERSELASFTGAGQVIKADPEVVEFAANV